MAWVDAALFPTNVAMVTRKSPPALDPPTLHPIEEEGEGSDQEENDGGDKEQEEEEEEEAESKEAQAQTMEDETHRDDCIDGRRPRTLRTSSVD